MRQEAFRVQAQSNKSTIVRLIAVALLLHPSLAWAQDEGKVAGLVSSPLATTPEMRAWIHRRVPRTGTPESRWRRLARELLVPDDGRDFVETPLVTTTAAEAFVHRRANCVAFAHLAVALAREVGLPAYFVLAVEVADGNITEDGERLAEGHLAVGFGPPGRFSMLDLGGLRDASADAARRISDAAARAVFYSNRGAEALLAGQPNAALEWLHTAVRLEPGLSRLWLNLGVAERRAGRPWAAARAYQRAVALEPALARLSRPAR